MSNADDDMDKPITRRELREVLGEAFANFLTMLDKRFELTRLENVAEHAATRAFVTAEIARHTTANADQIRTAKRQRRR